MSRSLFTYTQERFLVIDPLISYIRDINRKEYMKKMTKQELSTLMIDKITFITTDKKDKETTWTTSPDVDHSSLCDGWDVEDFEVNS